MKLEILLITRIAIGFLNSLSITLADNITSKKISLGMSRGEKVTVLDSFSTALGRPPNDII